MFKELMSHLRALEMYYKTAHWQVKNSTYYGDHLLLDRLSEEAGERIDQVAEKAVSITGETAIVDLPEHLKLTYQKIKLLPYNQMENAKYFESALILEQSLLEFCKTIEPTQTVGARNMLGDIADESEARVYLLKQRLSKA